MARKLSMVGRCKTLLAGLALIYLSGCSLSDVRHNIVSGALGFVEDYTIGVLEAFFPPPGEVIEG